MRTDENTSHQAKFSIGDKVIFTNDYGVEFKGRTIAAHYTGSYFSDSIQRYFIAPTDCPWCPVEENNLKIEGNECEGY